MERTDTESHIFMTTTNPPSHIANPLEVSTPVSLFGHDKTQFGSSAVVISVFVCGTLLAALCYAIGQLIIYLYRKFDNSEVRRDQNLQPA